MYSKLCTGVVPITYKCNERKSPILKITPHHMSGVMDAANCAAYHRDANVQSSANYYIRDNQIVSGVPEEYRAWTSSSEWNDTQAITIEVSNSSNSDPNWPISEASFESLVALCTDICQRYGIEPSFTGDTNGSITWHSFYAATDCPGKTLKARTPELVNRIKQNLNKQNSKGDIIMKSRYDLFTQFMNTWMGRGCNFDGVVGDSKNYQCVDEYKLWLDFVGYPNPKRPIGGDGYAHSIWYNKDTLGLGQFFDYVTSNYQYGDVVIYTRSGMTPDTHVGHFVKSYGNGWHQCFGFNQGGDMSGRIIDLPDYAILGGLRLKDSKIPRNASGYLDVDEHAYSFNSICWMRQTGLMTGKTADIFAPVDPITRGEIVTVMRRLKNTAPIAKINPFVDVKKDAFYYEGVMYAIENSITQGSGEKFRPEANATRAEVATMIYRLCGSPDTTGLENPFTDVDNNFYTEAIKWCYSKKIVNGTHEGIFEPWSACTREQFAVIFDRMYHREK